MKKFPIELLSTKSANISQGSVAIFDGSSIAISPDAKHNIISIVRDLENMTHIAESAQESSLTNAFATCLNYSFSGNFEWGNDLMYNSE